MDTKKMREQFEAWVLREWPEQSLARFTTGEYQGFTVEHCWQAWKASREAVVVDLPRPYESAPPYACYEGGWNDMRVEAVDVIEAMGLKVAP
ncbi:TPA: hypothetical protein QEM72_002673 [Pseudomonas putida]|uniref:hypothetical protein n=1 Tax=Pseudomonas putida TaxID=303 RepID=UPI0023633201|nr:hypothetical protein [Pseudomonas putida]MDD2076409.1 hypothetical protein [Pseudomonas putida]HDS1692169.1 hypothetical protein [Pseudomonas putida]